MPAITLADAEAKLAKWMAAEEALATSQSYTIDVDGSSRTLTRADLKVVGQRIDYWNSKVIGFSRRARGSSRTRYIKN